MSVRDIRAWLVRLGGLFGKQRRDRELAEELESHLAMHAEDNLRSGMSPAEARRQAAIKLGGIEAIKEEYRGRRGVPALENLARDLRYAVRVLGRSPGFTAVSVLTLALGVGANTAIFSAVNHVLLRPLPYQQPDALVMVWETSPKLGFPHNDVAPANFIDWRAQNRVFSQLAAFGGHSASLTGRGEPERVEGARVSASLFPLLGVAPSLGRAFTAEEDRPGAEHVVVISHGLWQRRFGGDPGLVGQRLTLDNRPHTVVGIMPAPFRFPGREQEFWVPMAFGPEEAAGRGDHYLNVVARLRPDVTRQQAQAEMDAIASRLEEQHPRTNTGQGVALVPLHEEFAGDVRQPLLILMGVVGFVLLIACANVANLSLARAATRQKELTIRGALGASRLRLVRQLLTESLLLAGLGGGAGTLLGVWTIELLETLIPDTLAEARGIAVDWRVPAFAAAVSLVTGLVFGLLPASQVSGSNLTEALKEGGRGGAGGGRHGRLRGALIIGEVALSLVLLAGAGLMVRSFYRLTHVDPGFQPDGALTMRMQLSGEEYGDPVRRRAFYDRLLGEVGATPGVRAAGVITQLPLTGQGLHFTFSLEGQPPLPTSDLPQAVFRVVSQDYFSAMGIPLLRGRSFTPQDTEESPAVAVINRTMAERFWPGQDALGRRFKVGPADSPNPWCMVVGVVGDVRQLSLDQELKFEMYVSYLQDRRFFAVPRDLVVRTDGDPLGMAATVRGRIRNVDRNLPLFRVQTLEQILSLAVSGQRFQMLLLNVFAALSLTLAAIGIYGVMSYATAQRTHEIGIRMALGAGARDVLRMVMRRGLVLTLSGVAVGLAGAFALTRVMGSLLFGVSPTDPSTLTLSTLLLVAVSLLACYVPARRAARVDPLAALRHE